MSYHTKIVNKALVRVYKDDELIGEARRGLDGNWYPELPYERNEAAAVHRVLLAHEAMAEFAELFDEPAR